MESAIWTEKYRPTTFSEIRGQEAIVGRVRAFVKQKNMPHLLFAGPAGVGKSTLALVIARELFKDTWKENFLELNASDERGIDVVRVKVKDFARTKAIGDVPFKIIFLDECDALTREAQQALRRTMEKFTKTCRFVLSCNYSSKIIDPIQSRCAVFKFKPLPEEDINTITEMISKKEGLKLGSGVKKALYELSEGDCRKLENLLQSSAALSKEITEEMIYSIASRAFPKEVRMILDAAVAGDFTKSRALMMEVMMNKGLSGLDLIKQVQKQIWELEVDARKKLEMVKLCGEVEFRMVEGSDEYIQVEALLAGFGLISK